MACGGSSTTPSSPTASAPPATDEVEIIDPPEPLEAQDEAAYESNPCQGTDLDLGSLAAQSLCNLDRTAAPLPKGLVASLSSDTLQIEEGTPSEIRVELANPSASPMRVELDASCHFLNTLELAIYRQSTRIDRVSDHCDVEAKVDCSGHAIGVTLAPGGEAFIRVTIPARVALLGEKKCVEYESRVLSPGPYKMVVRSVFSEEPLIAPMNIFKLERLPTGRCASYAKKVAVVAEPDSSLRADVAAALAEQCTRKPPSQEFANCQLAAKSADALQACGSSK